MKNLFLLLSIFTIFHAHANQTQNSTWVSTSAKNKLNDKWALSIGTELRYGHTFGKMNQTLFAVGAFKNVKPKSKVGYSYTFLHSTLNSEQRLSFHYLRSLEKKSKLLLSDRLNLEARFFEDTPDDSVRLRYLFRIEQDKAHYGVVVWNEIFLNMYENDFTGNTFIERNRFFLGFKNTAYNLKYELGYMNQFVPRDARNIDEHILMVKFGF